MFEAILFNIWTFRGFLRIYQNWNQIEITRNKLFARKNELWSNIQELFMKQEWSLLFIQE